MWNLQGPLVHPLPSYFITQSPRNASKGSPRMCVLLFPQFELRRLLRFVGDHGDELYR